MKLKKILAIQFLIIATIFLSSMGIKTEPIDLTKMDIQNTILEEYNEMNYKFVVTNYLTIKNKPIYLSEPAIYAIVNSLYKISNFSEVLAFTNFSFNDKFLKNNIKLIIAFSLSELGQFSNSQNMLKEITNEYFKYFDPIINYYLFRNEIQQSNIIIAKNLNPKLLNEDDIKMISTLISSSDDNFVNFVSSLLGGIKTKSETRNLVLKLLSRKYSNREILISVARNLINSGFTKEGYQLILTTSLPNPVKDFYRANLMILNKDLKSAQKLLEELLKNYQKYQTTLKLYNTQLDDILVSLGEIKKENPEEFEKFSLSYLKDSSNKFKTYVLRNYKIIEPQTHLTFITNYFEKVDLTYQTKTFVSAFVSYHLHKKNYVELKKFSDFMLEITKNTDWEREFYLLKFILEEDKREEISKKILTEFPFTYEYIKIYEYIKKDTNNLQKIISYLSSEYQKLHEDYKTNSTVDKLNKLIGIDFILRSFNINQENKLDLAREIKKQLTTLLHDTPTETNLTKTNQVTQKIPHYVFKYYEEGLKLDAHLEVMNLTKSPDINLISSLKELKMYNYTCRSTENFGLSKSLYYKRGFFTLAFLDTLFPTPFPEKVEIYSQKYGIDKSLIYGIMRQESRFSPFTLSTANAMGLMQLIESTANETSRKTLGKKENLTPIDIYEIKMNLELGIAHIKELYDTFKDYPENLRETLVIASYNAGKNAVREWYKNLNPQDEIMLIDGIRYHETREYTKKIVENTFVYRNFVFSNWYLIRN